MCLFNSIHRESKHNCFVLEAPARSGIRVQQPLTDGIIVYESTPTEINKYITRLTCSQNDFVNAYFFIMYTVKNGLIVACGMWGSQSQSHPSFGRWEILSDRHRCGDQAETGSCVFCFFCLFFCWTNVLLLVREEVRIPLLFLSLSLSLSPFFLVTVLCSFLFGVSLFLLHPLSLYHPRSNIYDSNLYI